MPSVPSVHASLALVSPKKEKKNTKIFWSVSHATNSCVANKLFHTIFDLTVVVFVLFYSSRTFFLFSEISYEYIVVDLKHCNVEIKDSHSIKKIKHR